MKKKGQAWSVDLVIAGVIFTIGILVLFVYSINYSSQSKDKMNELSYEGNLASNLILSEESFGILAEKKVDSFRLENFDCTSARKQFNMANNFYFILGEESYCEIPENPRNMAKVTRITVYENKPVKFEIITYD